MVFWYRQQALAIQLGQSPTTPAGRGIKLTYARRFAWAWGILLVFSMSGLANFINTSVLEMLGMKNKPPHYVIDLEIPEAAEDEEMDWEFTIIVKGSGLSAVQPVQQPAIATMDTPEIIELFEEVIRKFDYFNIGEIVNADVVQFFRELRKQHEDDPVLWMVEAFALLSCSDYDGSKRCFASAFRLGVSKADCRFVSALIDIWIKPNVDIDSWRAKAVKNCPGKPYCPDIINRLAEAATPVI